MSLLNCFLSSTCTCVTNRTCRGLQLMLSFSITVAQSSACLYLHSTICLCIFLSRLFNLGVLNVCQKCLAISSGCCRRFHIGMVYKKYAIVSSSSSWCAMGLHTTTTLSPTLHKQSSHVFDFSSQLYNLPCFALIYFQEPHSLRCDDRRENH